MIKDKLFYFAVILSFVMLYSCGKNYTPDQLKYINELEQYRKEYNDYMKNSSDSPFNYKGKVEFHQLNYYEPNFDFIFKSKLTEFDTKDTVSVYGTKGEERKTVRFGYLGINYENNIHKINVYQGETDDGQVYYSLWFTDKTTNDETYGVGRYLHFDFVNDPKHLYTIDFNYAFNPYCAYSKDYSCAIPRKEDHLNIAIEAGEKNFHD